MGRFKIPAFCERDAIALAPCDNGRMGGTTEETPARSFRTGEDDWGHRFRPDARYPAGYAESGRRGIGAFGRKTRRTAASR